MHKIFAKPLFLGKKVVFLPHCHSTNDELALLSRNEPISEGYIVYTDHQERGKGQRGNTWVDEPGKNILMSLFLRPKKLEVAKQFYLNLMAGLAVLDTIKSYDKESEVSLKWPNDVYLNEKKVAGILIESNIRGSTFESVIMGIGINLNQQGFSLPLATSLMLELCKPVDREAFMEELLCQIEKWYLRLSSGRFTEILDVYHSVLMWKGEWHQFEAEDGTFEGMVKGIDQQGRLVIQTRDGVNRRFQTKEVSFKA